MMGQAGPVLRLQRPELLTDPDKPGAASGLPVPPFPPPPGARVAFDSAGVLRSHHVVKRWSQQDPPTHRYIYAMPSGHIKIAEHDGLLCILPSKARAIIDVQPPPQKPPPNVAAPPPRGKAS